MKFCIPIESDNGFKSQAADHFGTAPLFMIIDTETRQHAIIPNADIDHAEGCCDPFRAIGGEQVDIVITGSLGGGALQKLNAVGVAVYKAEGETVMDNLNLLADSCLHEFVLVDGMSSGQDSCCPH